jgi:spore maturation protein CgeB
MHVLYCETSAAYPSNPLFLEAFEQLCAIRAIDYAFIDESVFLRRQRTLIERIARRLFGSHPYGYRGLNSAFIERARDVRPQLVLISKGANIAPATLKQIKQETNAVLINYATDDPFNPVNSNRQLVKSIPLYDLYVCTKRNIMADVRSAGCPRVIYVPFAYKPSVHFPEELSSTEEKDRFGSDVVFIGGGDRDRFPYLNALLQAIPNLKLQLYGGYWNRDPVLVRYHRGFAYGREFRMALSGAKIALNLVRRANRDGHVMRTFEIPACGAFMLAERTAEHLEFFEEDNDVAYFGSAKEMVDKVRYYLAHESDRRRIAEAGYRKVVNGGHTYKDRLVQIVAAAIPNVSQSENLAVRAPANGRSPESA